MSDKSDRQNKVISKSLEAAYRDTNYCVPTEDKLIVLRVDEASEDIRRLMVDTTNNATFMTAHNPFSEILSDGENTRANARLQQELIASFPNVLPCYGASIDEEYREESFLVFPIMRDKAIELCIKYDQNAVLFVGPDGVPELVFHPEVCVESQV